MHPVDHILHSNRPMVGSGAPSADEPGKWTAKPLFIPGAKLWACCRRTLDRAIVDYVTAFGNAVLAVMA